MSNMNDETFDDLIGSMRPDRTMAMERRMITAYEEAIIRFRRVLGGLQKATDLWREHWQYGNMDEPVLNDMFSMSSWLASRVVPLSEGLQAKINEWTDKLAAKKAVLAEGGSNGPKQG